MLNEVPPIEKEGGKEQSDVVKTIIAEVHNLCNRFASERAELEVPIAENQQLYIRYETIVGPSQSDKSAIISMQYRNEENNLVFTMYECIAKKINGKCTFQLIKVEGSVIGGASETEDVTDTQECEVPINWLKEAHNKLVNANSAEVV